MTKGKELSRRDFLKVSGVIGAAAVTTGATTALLSACRELKLLGEIPEEEFSPETIILNGKTTSIGENNLDIITRMHVDMVKSKLDQARQGNLSLNNPGGYKGATFPTGWEPDFDRVVIMVNKTDSGQLISQVFISRKKIDTPVPDGVSKGWHDFMDDINESFAYNEHSLLVVDENKNTLWFDNVESVTDKGKTRISVDGSTGKVMQITTNKPNLFKSLFNGEAPSISLSEIDILTGESSFTKVSTPFSQNFLNILSEFIARLPAEYTKAQKLDIIKYYFSGSRLNERDIDTLKKNLTVGPEDPYNQVIDAISRFSLHFPYNDEELAFVTAVLSNFMKDFFDNGVIQETFETAIRIAKSPVEYFNTEYFNRKKVEELLEMRTKLPMGAPELYFVQTKNKKGTQEWHLIGRYSTRENDQTKVISTQKDGFSIGEYWVNFGEVNSEIVDNSLLRDYETIINKNFPFEDIIKRYPEEMGELGFEIIGGVNEMIEVRRVSPEAIIFAWDPSENDLNVKIKPGLMVDDRKGGIRFLLLRQDNFLDEDILNLPLYSNRWLPLLGNSPNVVIDVSDQVIDLIRKGYLSTSIFGFIDPYAYFSLLGHLDPRDPESYVNYDFLRGKFPEAIINMVQPGQFLGGSDNAVLLYSENKEGVSVEIHKYDKNGNFVDNIEVTHPIIFAPRKIGYYNETGEPYIVMAVDEKTGETYVADLKDTFMLGARSAKKLGMVITLELATVLAALYGGNIMINNPQAITGFLKHMINKIASKLISN